MSFLPHPIDQCKLESQPRNKLHIFMGRIVIVDAVIYCPDPCSKTKTRFLHPPEALAIDGSQMSHPDSPTPDRGIVVCQRELPDSKLYIPHKATSVHWLRHLTSKEERFSRVVSYSELLRLTKATLETTLKFKFSLYPIPFPKTQWLKTASIYITLHGSVNCPGSRMIWRSLIHMVGSLQSAQWVASGLHLPLILHQASSGLFTLPIGRDGKDGHTSSSPCTHVLAMIHCRSS